MSNKYILCVTAVTSLLLGHTMLPEEVEAWEPSSVEECEEVAMPMTRLDARVTVYNPVEGQCDDTPLVTASGARIDTVALKHGKIRWCAVSRDILETYSFGDTIDIYINRGHEFNGKWVIKDVMNARFRNRIDLLTYDRKYGRWDATYL